MCRIHTHMFACRSISLGADVYAYTTCVHRCKYAFMTCCNIHTYKYTSMCTHSHATTYMFTYMHPYTTHIYTRIPTHICIHICIHINGCVCLDLVLSVCVCLLCRYKHVCICIVVYVCTHACTYIYIYTYTRMHTCMYACMYAYTHTNTYTYICIPTYKTYAYRRQDDMQTNAFAYTYTYSCVQSKTKRSFVFSVAAVLYYILFALRVFQFDFALQARGHEWSRCSRDLHDAAQWRGRDLSSFASIYAPKLLK